jgi:predicted metal-dependent RNase
MQRKFVDLRDVVTRWFHRLCFIGRMDMMMPRDLRTRIAETTDVVREIVGAPANLAIKRLRFAASLTEATIEAARAELALAEADERARITGAARGSIQEARDRVAKASRLVGEMTTLLSRHKTDEVRALRKAGPQVAERLAPHIGDAVRQALEAIAVAEEALDPIAEVIAFADRNAVPIPRPVAKEADLAMRLLRQIRVTLGKANGGLH